MNLPTFDFEAHLARQAAFSAHTFGPGARTEGICDHIRKELLEVAAAPGDLKEWIDVAILALDGAWRCGATPGQIIGALVAKQSKNEGRAWPDWRTADPAKAIEHDRSAESERVAANGMPQPIVGRLMDQISALPVLWGLNEPGALLRNSDVWRVLVAAGREQPAVAAAPAQSVTAPDGAVVKAAQALLDEHKAACLTDPMYALIEMAEDDEEASVSAVLLADLFRAIGTYSATQQRGAAS